MIEDNGTIQFSLGILGDKVLLIKTTKRDGKKPRKKKKEKKKEIGSLDED